MARNSASPTRSRRWRNALTDAAGGLKQFQEKCEAVFRPELRLNKEIGRFAVSLKRRNALGIQVDVRN
ncbi:hypothetical protein FJ957_18740 [Mesorhizobium sp. B2-4-6]|nr:hypothetical protein FJW10_03940 [Mesorhizobium sp. B4-1-1]TPL45826.1 hypothetical protein FJ957_18740 [Mesorhizobium sp. B2-4-6]